MFDALHRVDHGVTPKPLAIRENAVISTDPPQCPFCLSFPQGICFFFAVAFALAFAFAFPDN